MGILHQLWDETLAGPAPDTGLGKLRKYNSARSAQSAAPPRDNDDLIPVSRSITIVRRDDRRNLTVSVGSPASSEPASPAGSSTPTSPFSPNSPGGNFRKWMRRKPASGALHNSEPESKSYDWFVFDRYFTFMPFTFFCLLCPSRVSYLDYHKILHLPILIPKVSVEIEGSEFDSY